MNLAISFDLQAQPNGLANTLTEFVERARLGYGPATPERSQHKTIVVAFHDHAVRWLGIG
jgi:hypothetical protein